MLKVCNKNQKYKGFTLLELSIVLVIISLLIAGTFRVLSLVENSRVDRIINDLEAFKIAYYSYYDRTGDFPGNGSAKDRFIDYDAVGVNDGSFFLELFKEGFIKSKTPRPLIDSEGNYFVNFLPATSSTDLNTGSISGKNQACITGLKKSYSRHLDFELDDGVWNTGTVRTTADFDDLEKHTLCLEI